MTFYDFAAPFYGIWAAFVETRAYRLAREALAMHPGRDLLERRGRNGNRSQRPRDWFGLPAFRGS